MEIAQAANFLAASILLSLGIIVIGIAIVVLNNIAHKYWKPVKVWQFHSYPPDVNPSIINNTPEVLHQENTEKKQFENKKVD
jgi:hypothetical protein